MEVNLNIKAEEDLYYFYHNWQAGQKNKIHKATCSRCSFGSGRNLSKPPKRGENGVWIGPFSSLVLCEDYVGTRLGVTVPPHCKFCLLEKGAE